MTRHATGHGDRREEGAAAVEFALCVPLVLLVILGVIQYGYQYWSLETASATAREAARRMSVGTDWTCTQQEAVDHASMPAVGATAPQVSLQYENLTNTAVRGDLLTVTVRFQSLNMGLLPVPDGGAIEQSATSRVENIPIDPLLC